MTPRLLFATALCAALLTGCNKPASDDAAPAGDTAPLANEAAEPAADGQPTDVLKAVDNAPAPEGLDVRAFAGSFSGTIPCADCPGIDSTLTLDADGSYTTHDVYQERDASFDSSGTWTVEEAGKRIRLDPNSKDEQDRLLEVVSNDELRMLDADGNAIESGLNYTLTRTAAAAR
ncbi:copper resistance protein NlpE [Luteimonas lutimaris]|uniref:Copper resistance protein NlpE n=1 Tax=Luteimonas lutimaris TaxID=698645 RepID=A0ABP7MC48_9GAMM